MRNWELVVEVVSGPAILLKGSDVVSHNGAASQLCRSLGCGIDAFAWQASETFHQESVGAKAIADSWQEFSWKRNGISHPMKGRLVSRDLDLVLLLADPLVEQCSAIDVSALEGFQAKEGRFLPPLSRDVDRFQYKRAEAIARAGSYRLETESGKVHVSRFLQELLLGDVVTPPTSLDDLLYAFSEAEAEKIGDLHSALIRGAKTASADVVFVDQIGNELILEIRCECDRDDKGRPRCIYGAVIDVTQRAEEAEKVRFIAYHDALTGLPNRANFMQVSPQFLADAAGGAGSFALHLVDLDGFKDINDSLGHLAGDQVLQLVAQRLTSNIRGSDMAFRFGGDEFAILHRGIGSIDCVERLGQRLASKLGEPFEIGSEVVTVGASMGGALFQEGECIQHMMLRADEMLYAVKRSGKGAFKLAA